jgi:hypothetical protein
MADDTRRPISGRKREQDVLRRLVESPRAELLAIYGRRRVGKTFLVRQFFAGKANIFEVTGRHDGSMHDQLRVFGDALAETFHAGAELAPPSSWHEAFRRLRVELVRRRRGRRKWVLFFDELPWLATHKSGCLGELDHFWNNWCSKQPNVIVVVCGSAASWMLRNIVHARGGLHNRLTESMRLLPFGVRDAHRFLLDRGVRLTEHQMLELYMALGGVPHYLDKVPRGTSMAQAIDWLCFAPDAPLAKEFDHVFASLFGEDDIYRRIVQKLSSRRIGFSRTELLAALDVTSGGTANRVLTNLEEAGFIQTAVPFGRTRRDRHYRLIDELTLFHLRWMKGPARTGPYWAAIRGRAAWHAWSGLAFEALCLKHVDCVERALGISGVLTEASSWQHRSNDESHGAQIDLLIDRADDVISVCELKHTINPFVVTKGYAEALRRKLAVFHQVTKTRKALQLVLVSSNGVADNPHAGSIIDAKLDKDIFWKT